MFYTWYWYIRSMYFWSPLFLASSVRRKVYPQRPSGQAAVASVFVSRRGSSSAVPLLVDLRQIGILKCCTFCSLEHFTVHGTRGVRSRRMPIAVPTNIPADRGLAPSADRPCTKTSTIRHEEALTRPKFQSPSIFATIVFLRTLLVFRLVEV